MPSVRLRLPSWTRHPVFGGALLLILAIALIAHGEPQPSSRPSGRSVVVSSATPSDLALPATLLIAGGTVQRHAGGQIRRIALPVGVKPVSVITAHGYSVILGVSGGRQRAYGVSAALKVTDLGFADNVVPAATAPAAVVIERAISDPGRVIQAQPTPTRSLSDTQAGPRPSSSTGSATGGPYPAPGPTKTGPTKSEPTKSEPTRSGPARSGAATSRPVTSGPTVSGTSVSRPAVSGTDSSTPGQPNLERDYSVRRYDSLGRPVGLAVDLPEGEQIATDSAVGFVAWKPVNLVVDRGQITESLSATASLVRPDGSLRVIGPFHPLAATGHDLLVWDVARGAFGLLPLTEATASTTRTASTTASATAATASVSATLRVDSSTSASRRSSAARPSTTPSSSGLPGSSSQTSPAPSASPTSVAGARFFQPTRGFIVTGPSSFSPDGTTFAAYAVVGNRRRLVIGDVSQVGTDQIAVLALSQAEAEQHPSASGSTGGVSGVSVSGTVTAAASRDATPLSLTPSASGAAPTKHVSPSPSATIPTFQPEGFPVSAPAAPVWLTPMLVVAVATDGTVVGYTPGNSSASVLDLGTTGVLSLAGAP